jgi:hypothetical protein
MSYKHFSKNLKNLLTPLIWHSKDIWASCASGMLLECYLDKNYAWFEKLGGGFGLHFWSLNLALF